MVQPFSAAITPKVSMRRINLQQVEEELSVSISEEGASMAKEYQAGMAEFQITMDRLDQLCVQYDVLPDGKKFISHKSTQTEPMISKSCQTIIQAAHPKYDRVLLTQETLDSAVKESELREYLEKSPGIETMFNLLSNPDTNSNEAFKLAMKEVPQFVMESVTGGNRNLDSPFSLPDLQEEIRQLKEKQSPFYWKSLEAYTSKMVAMKDLTVERKVLNRAKDRLTKENTGLDARISALEKDLKSKEMIIQKINSKVANETNPTFSKDFCLALIKDACESKDLDPQETNTSKPETTPGKDQVALLEESKSRLVTLAKNKFSVNTKKRTALSIVENVKMNREKKGKYYIPVKQTLKCITSIYTERLKESKLRQIKNDQLFAEYVYDYYVNSFGFISIAEPKLLSFVISVKNNRNKPRISLFGKFMGIDSVEEYSIEDLNKYIEGLDFLTTSVTVHTVNNGDSDVEHNVPLLRCIEYLRKFGEDMSVPMADLLDMRKETEIS